MTALELRASGELAIPRRLVDAVRTLLFLLVSLVVGIGDLVFLPIAAIAGPAAVRRMLEFERALVNRLLCARVPAPPPLAPDTTVTGQQLAFLAGKLPISLGAAILCALPTALFVELVAHSIQGAHCEHQLIPRAVAPGSRRRTCAPAPRHTGPDAVRGRP